MLVVNTETVPGYEVEKVIGCVSAVSQSRLKDLFVNSEKLLNKLSSAVIERLIEEAGNRGANAIVGLRVTPFACAHADAAMHALGTAVVIREADN